MKIEQVLPFITDGRIFTIEFTKRSTGQNRIMNARMGVKKGVKGVGKSFSDSEHNLITVWDMAKQAFRSIAVESITKIKAGGQELTVTTK